MKKILVTGGADFIGSNFIRYILNKYSDYEVINLDKLSYASNINSLLDVIKDKKYKFIKGSINDYKLLKEVFSNKIDYVINFAAESHVDRSIEDPLLFTINNTIGTHTLLETARIYGVEKFIQVSTDEVYGTLGKYGLFSETSNLNPTNPYSASKASADLICLSYYKTYQFPIVITRCCNNYGPYQFPEKLIPLMTINALNGNKLPVYGDGENIREWIYVIDHCRAIDMVMESGKLGEVYNIGTGQEESNIKIVKTILKILDKTEEFIEFVEDRPGHDLRYALDNTKIVNEIGWRPIYDLGNGLIETIKWYVENAEWWNKLIH